MFYCYLQEIVLIHIQCLQHSSSSMQDTKNFNSDFFFKWEIRIMHAFSSNTEKIWLQSESNTLFPGLYSPLCYNRRHTSSVLITCSTKTETLSYKNIYIKVPFYTLNRPKLNYVKHTAQNYDTAHKADNTARYWQYRHVYPTCRVGGG